MTEVSPSRSRTDLRYFQGKKRKQAAPTFAKAGRTVQKYAKYTSRTDSELNAFSLDRSSLVSLPMRNPPRLQIAMKPPEARKARRTAKERAKLPLGPRYRRTAGATASRKMYRRTTRLLVDRRVRQLPLPIRALLLVRLQRLCRGRAIPRLSMSILHTLRNKLKLEPEFRPAAKGFLQNGSGDESTEDSASDEERSKKKPKKGK